VSALPPSGEHLEWLTPKPELRDPILIVAFEGWNDAGDAATIAAGHLAERLDATPIAEIDPEVFYDFSTTRPIVHLDQERQRSLTWPTNQLMAAKVPAASRDVVILVGVEPQLRWRAFCDTVVSAARELGVNTVLTLGALLSDVPHSRPVDIYGATDNEDLMASLNLSRSSYEGPTGIVGVLSTTCRNEGFTTISFWAAVPSYVPGAPSPKAGLALVHRTSELLATSLYVTDLEISAASYERQIDELIAEDEDTAAYVADLEEAWDAEDEEEDLADDPELLVAEVEDFLRDTNE
jgi:proteasome assembly chaperone (PAC2) family protein